MVGILTQRTKLAQKPEAKYSQFVESTNDYTLDYTRKNEGTKSEIKKPARKEIIEHEKFLNCTTASCEPC